MNLIINNFGYEYAKRLYDAIDSSAILNIKKNKKYFFYKGVDYCSAYKRLMHLEMENSGYLEDLLFDRSHIDCNNSCHTILLREMFPNLIVSRSNSLRKKYNLVRLKYYLGRYRGVRYIYNIFFLKLKDNSYSQEDVALIVLHVKFIRFLKGIYDRLDNCIFVICGDYKECIKYCTQNKIKYIVFRNDTYSVMLNEDKLHLSKLILMHINVVNFFSQFDFTVYLLPEGDAAFYEVINLFTKHDNTACICIQHGWDSMIWTGNRDMHYKYFLTWGVFWHKYLEKYNSGQEFKVVGAPSHKPVNSNVKTYKSILFLLQGESVLINTHRLQGFLDLIENTAREHSNVSIVVREHPSCSLDEIHKEYLLKMGNVCFKNSKSYTLSEAMEDTLIAVSIYSTVLVESIDYDVIPIMLNTPGITPVIPDFNKFNIGVEVWDNAGALLSISKILLDSNFRDNILHNIKMYKKDMFLSNNVEAVNNVVRVVNYCRRTLKD